VIGDGVAMVMLGWRGWRMAAVVAAGAGLLAASCGGGSRAVTSARPRPCAASDLHVGFGHQVSLYTGHVVRSLVFINHSSAACTLDGYPAVSFVTAPGGRQLGAAAGHIPAPVRLVVLVPDARAQATLLLTNVLIYSSGCSPRPRGGCGCVLPASALLVTLPRPGGSALGRCSGSGSAQSGMPPEDQFRRPSVTAGEIAYEFPRD
jgi:hypothetical protein